MPFIENIFSRRWGPLHPLNGVRCSEAPTRGDALSIYFGDPTLATAFVARWCAGYQIETAGGVFQVRQDEPTFSTPRVPEGVIAQPSARRSRRAML